MNQDKEEKKVSRYEPRSKRKESVKIKIKKKGKYPGMNQDQEERKVPRHEPRSRSKESTQARTKIKKKRKYPLPRHEP